MVSGWETPDSHQAHVWRAGKLKGDDLNLEVRMEGGRNLKFGGPMGAHAGSAPWLFSVKLPRFSSRRCNDFTIYSLFIIRFAIGWQFLYFVSHCNTVFTCLLQYCTEVAGLPCCVMHFTILLSGAVLRNLRVLVSDSRSWGRGLTVANVYCYKATVAVASI